jgi:hypothetical protein
MLKLGRAGHRPSHPTQANHRLWPSSHDHLFAGLTAVAAADAFLAGLATAGTSAAFAGPAPGCDATLVRWATAGAGLLESPRSQVRAGRTPAAPRR